MTITHPANIDIAAALSEAQELYRARNPKSLAQYEEACAALPGGNTRSAIFVEPFPLTMVRGHGSRLWDLDGHEYVDFLSEFTAGLYGHSHPLIRRALDRALDSGVNFGAHGAAEQRDLEQLLLRDETHRSRQRGEQRPDVEHRGVVGGVHDRLIARDMFQAFGNHWRARSAEDVA